MWERAMVCFALLGMAILQTSMAQEVVKRDVDVQAMYDNYPMVSSKRSALLLDRLLVVLHRALEDKGVVPQAGPDFQPLANIDTVSQRLDGNEESLKRTNPQRRGPANTRKQGNVWQCYFNAVSCFGKK